MNIVPSIELIPAKYGVGTLLTQVPMDVSGDFSVTRATAVSTRYNSAGLIETIPSGIPRLDYYTSSGTPGCPALLVEPSGTNLVVQSEAFNTFWTPLGLNAFGSGSVANSTGTTDPFGGTNSEYIQENSASGTHVILQINAGQVSGTNLTFSVFAKSAERTQINLLNNGGGGGNATFNLTAGTATLASGVSASIQNYGNGWYRCILTYTPSATGNFNVQVRLADASGNTSYNGTGNSGLYIFGAQVEAGSVPTSYIPTTTGSVTRDADVINKTGVSGLIGQTEGTIYAEVDMRALSIARTIFGVSLNSNTTDFANIQINSSNQIFARIRSGSGTLQDVTASSTITGIAKIAMAYSSSGSILVVNGTIIGTNASGIPSWATSVNFVHVGNGPAAASGSSQSAFFNDRIRAAAIYKTRLPNYLLESATSQIQSYSALASSLSYTVV
jgi:hypothetical protein